MFTAKAILPTLLIMAGCSDFVVPAVDGPTADYPPFPSNRIEVRKIDEYGATLTRVEYEDGVRCVILALGVRRRGGGIECDYGNLQPQPPSK